MWRPQQSDFLAAPFVVIGYHPASGEISGYVSALRIQAGRTDACSFAFAGHAGPRHGTPVTLQNASVNKHGEIPRANSSGSGELRTRPTGTSLLVASDALPGDCDWILESVGEPGVKIANGVYTIELLHAMPIEATMVRVVRVKRAFLHKTPSPASREKAYLVAGDYVFVTEEHNEYYRMTYSSGKKRVDGWLRKSDTLVIQ